VSSPQDANTTGGSSSVPWVLTHRRLVSIGAHTVLFVVSWATAFLLAYNFKHFNQWLRPFFLPLLPIAVLVKVTVFVAMGSHRARWRYVSLRDVFNVAQASWLSFFGIFLIYYALQNIYRLGVTSAPFAGEGFPDVVFMLDFAGTIALVCGARFAVRLYNEEARPDAEGGAPQLLLLGAGNAAENAVREILRLPRLHYRLVGFLDDDPAKIGTRIHGFDVLGPIANVQKICEEYEVDELLIAMPSATRAQMRKVVELCQGTGLRFKTLPAMEDLIAGRATVSEIRNVDINDLLGRAPVKLDQQAIGCSIAGRVVLVTGAGGSIGSEMCRQIARFGPQRLVLVEQAEQHLFEVDRELGRNFPALQRVAYIADITDKRRIEHLFELERPSVVYHAAAHKHVPMMEDNPGEALKNNINGTRMVADAACRFGCEMFVMISTDKAVNPTSVMGCSKRIAEMYIQGLNGRSDTKFVTVRFGNVLGSSGSVIPIFREQIARGGPVTVTHPEMVRYFMTIPEASQLVLQAAAMSRGGTIFVLDMGEPVKIVDLAREMITLSGLRLEEDIKIEFTGVRPGEKLYEELMIDGEGVSRTQHPKIGIWQSKSVDFEALRASMNDLIARADVLSRDEIRAWMKELVPEYRLNGSASAPAAPVASVAGVKAANGATI
jgi:FlaA1/EpsC-like NDP-sugar epimerase